MFVDEEWQSRNRLAISQRTVKSTIRFRGGTLALVFKGPSIILREATAWAAATVSIVVANSYYQITNSLLSSTLAGSITKSRVVPRHSTTTRGSTGAT